jgi:nifR3 family TIM-barrel protein
MSQLKIANISFKNRLFLAPMVEVTDLPYRLICRKSGASMAYTEMLYIDAITHENEKTKQLMQTSKEDKPIGIQVTGTSPKEFQNSLKYFKPYDLIDLNCGCPAIRIMGNKAGSYLLTSPKKISKIIKILKTAEKPVTAKIRLGFSENTVLKIAKEIEKAGADAITVHARLANQGYSIPADLSQIKKVKDTVGIPVIGNGDILSGESAAKMLDVADAAMIARGAIGNPLIFKNILSYLRTGKEVPFNFKANIKLFREYLDLAKKHNCINVQRIKYIGTNFLKGTEGASSLRNDLMQLKSFEEIRNFAKNL